MCVIKGVPNTAEASPVSCLLPISLLFLSLSLGKGRAAGGQATRLSPSTRVAVLRAVRVFRRTRQGPGLEGGRKTVAHSKLCCSRLIDGNAASR